MTHQDVLTPGTFALGFGMMRMPDLEQSIQLVDTYLENGFNYFDTAYIYTGSEALVKNTLATRHRRDSFLLANKLPPWEVKNQRDSDRLFAGQLKRCGVEYFDFYMLHSLDDSRESFVETAGLFDWARQKKEAGYAKHIGFSFHGSTAYLERLLKAHPEVEFVQLQINYMDKLRGPAGEWQELALKYRVPFIVMEPVKGGSLAQLPAGAEALFKAHAPQRSVASWAIQYAATLAGSTVMLSGMSNMAQLKDNLATYKNHLRPLSPEEATLLEQVLEEMAKVATIPCTACKYCHAHCPVGINIASCFSLYNGLKRGDTKWNRATMYEALPSGKRAKDCTACEACHPHCPQKLNIAKGLKEVAAAF
ncbi:MAG: aldo/keto reductase [Defluviitaleaceae bacterium]|nr:aldo/keto reductase [Defluviitaleaceae bacterium]MCL2203805.1 aldo/keto reductase [Defluviitaleaceae bacterium]MCL2239274.1 aldo/keto reductase [Defluviitaleaceae bacterium]